MWVALLHNSESPHTSFKKIYKYIKNYHSETHIYSSDVRNVILTFTRCPHMNTNSLTFSG